MVGDRSACLSIRFISLTLIGVQLKHPQLLIGGDHNHQNPKSQFTYANIIISNRCNNIVLN